jgi:hypothetical protein
MAVPAFDQGRLGRRHDEGKDAGFLPAMLASDEAQWTSGAILAVDGGCTAG